MWPLRNLVYWVSCLLRESLDNEVRYSRAEGGGSFCQRQLATTVYIARRRCQCEGQFTDIKGPSMWWERKHMVSSLEQQCVLGVKERQVWWMTWERRERSWLLSRITNVQEKMQLKRAGLESHCEFVINFGVSLTCSCTQAIACVAQSPPAPLKRRNEIVSSNINSLNCQFFCVLCQNTTRHQMHSMFSRNNI